MTLVCELRWASETGAHTMPHPDELRYFGFYEVARDPRYPGAVLMRRDPPATRVRALAAPPYRSSPE